MAEALQALSVTCNHCGAPLEVPADTRFVTCQYCGARLEVHRSGGAAYTQVLASIDQRTKQIADDVDTIKLQNELERLDREWAAGQARPVPMNRNGQQLTHQPANWAGGATMAVFGVLWVGICLFMMVTAIDEGAPIIFPLACGGMILFFLLAVLAMLTQSGRQNAARARYESERSRLLTAMQQRRRPRMPRVGKGGGSGSISM